MNPLVKNIIAIVGGWLIGAAVNMGFILIGDMVIPAPAGVDSSDITSLESNMHLFQPKHFLFPFIAHALGTFVGAYVASRIAANNKRNIALAIGFLFLLGGITMVTMVPAPAWFSGLDLLLAYLPMAWLGWKLGKRPNRLA